MRCLTLFFCASALVGLWDVPSVWAQQRIQIQVQNGPVQAAQVQFGQAGEQAEEEGEDGQEIANAATFRLNRERSQLLRRAEEFLAEEQWSFAIQHLGAILDASEDFFSQPDRNVPNYVGLKARALDLIGRLPDAGRQTYQLEYSEPAKRMLREAVASGSPEKMAEVSRRFFHTDAGYEATYRLAMHNLEFGQPLAATLYLTRLSALPDVRNRLDPSLSLTLALCHLRLGTEEGREQAQSVLADLGSRWGGKPVVINGNRAPLPTGDDLNVDWLLATLGPQRTDSGLGREQWVMPGGNPARTAESVGGQPLLTPRWYNPTSGDQTKVRAAVARERLRLESTKVHLLPAMTPLAVRLDPKEASLLKSGDIQARSWPRLLSQFRDAVAKDEPSPMKHIWSLLSAPLRADLAAVAEGDVPPDALQTRFLAEMNSALSRRDFYQTAELWASIDLRHEAKDLLAEGPAKLEEGRLVRLNRLLLESAANARTWTIPDSSVELVLVRTFSYLVAYDFITGKKKWDVRYEEESDVLRALVEGGIGGGTGMEPMISSAVTNRAFRDRTFGSLTSDGRMVFSVEGINPSPHTSSGYQAAILNRNIPQRGFYAGGNRLEAHDLRSGAWRWTVGGPLPEDGDTSPDSLQGMFFLGPPLPLAGRLYVLADAGGEVRLVVLEAESGKLVWSQNLAQVPESARGEMSRQLAGVSPSYSGGVLVCPTACGAVVAFDLTTRSLLWGHRYESTLPEGPTGGVVMWGPGGAVMRHSGSQREGWVDSLARVSDGKVVLTSSESEQLQCLDLFTGQTIWAPKPREDGLYVACVEDGKILVIGAQNARAVSLTTGETIWTTPIAEDPSVSPSGRGFLANGRYYVPRTDRHVVSFDLEKGERRGDEADSNRAPEKHALGNLICFSGSVLAQGTDWIQRFALVESLEEQVRDALARNPKDANALARRGEIYLQRGQVQLASADLQLSLELEPDDPQTRKLLVDAILQGLATNFAGHRDELGQLTQLIDQMPAATRAEYKGRFLRLLAAGLQTSGDTRGAFDAYIQFADPGVDAEELESVAERWQVRRDRWVQGRLGELFASAEGDARTKMNEEIRRRLDEALASEGTAALARFLRFFSSHEFAIEAREELARRYSAEGQYLPAELILEQLLANEPEASEKAAATAQLAELLNRAGRPEDAAIFYRRLQSDYADVATIDDKTGTQLVEALGPDSPIRGFLDGEPTWPKGEVYPRQVTKTVTPRLQQPLRVEGPRSPYFPPGSVLLNAQGSQISWVGRDSLGKNLWEASPGDSRETDLLGLSRIRFIHEAHPAGHLLLVAAGQHLFAIDTISSEGSDKARIMWTLDMQEDLPGVQFGRGVQIVPDINRAGRKRFVMMDPYGHPVGPLGPVRSTYAAVIRRRELVVLDPLTGQTLWSRSDMPLGINDNGPESAAEMFGDDEHIFVIPDGETVWVFRASDGHLVRKEPVATRSHRLSCQGNTTVWWDWKSDENSRELVCTNHANGEVVWRQTFAQDAVGRLVDSNTEAAIYSAREGRLVIVGLSDGKVIVDKKLETDASFEDMYVTKGAGAYTAVVALNGPRANARTMVNPAVDGGISMPFSAAKAHGFDAETGEHLYSTEIENSALLWGQSSQLPVLVFAARVSNLATRPPSIRTEFTVLDRRTGRLVYERDYDSRISSYELQAFLDERKIELRVNEDNSTIELSFSDDPVAKE